jgi:hypothetical protein
MIGSNMDKLDARWAALFALQASRPVGAAQFGMANDLMGFLGTA